MPIDDHSPFDQYLWWMLKFLDVEMRSRPIDSLEESPITLDIQRLFLPLAGTPLTQSEKMKILEELEYQGAIKIGKKSPNVSQIEILFESPWNPNPLDDDQWLGFNATYFKYAEKFDYQVRSKSQSAKNPSRTKKLVFHEKASVLSYGGMECKIPSRKYEFYFLKRLLEEPIGAKVKDIDLEEAVNKGTKDAGKKEGSRKAYDARNRLNKKIEKAFALPELVHYETSEYWLEPEYFSDSG